MVNTDQPEQALRIIDRQGDDKNLSKVQRTFNQYVRRIQTLEHEIENYRTWTLLARQRVEKEIIPLEKQYADQRVALVRLLDRQHDSLSFRAGERKTLVDVLLNQCHDLIESFGRDELRPIFEKHNGLSFEDANSEAGVERGETRKEALEEMLGIEIDTDADVSSPEKLQAYLAQKLAEQQVTREQTERAAEERRASQKKSGRQLAAEARQQTEEKRLSTAVRKIYLDLVKTFHPDREPDEAERARKTAILQRVTQAYEADNLFELLKLQLEFQRIDRDHLDTLADEQLKAYNKLLKSQVDELEAELLQLRGGGFGFDNFESRFVAMPQDMDWKFDREKKRLKAHINQLKSELVALENPIYLRQVLKGHAKQQRQGPSPEGVLANV